MSMKLLSDAFGRGQIIPLAHGCYGEDVSPRFTWRGLPEVARSLVMILKGPGLRERPCTHWILFDIPVDVDGLSEGVERFAVEMAMNGHVLFAAEYSGRYECGENEHIVVPNCRWPGSAGDP